MKVLVTGAAGYIGRAVTAELLANGHQVLGLARSDASAEIITKAGGDVYRGDIKDLESLKQAAASCTGVIHLAYERDFTNMARAIAIDKAAITAMAEGISGTGAPFVYASGSLLLPSGAISDEDSSPDFSTPMALRAESEALVAELSKTMNIRGSVVRLAPIVHGPGDSNAFVSIFADLGRKNGFMTYVDQGTNRWPAVGLADVARLFRLALENGRSGAIYHGVGEESVPFKEIMEAIGRKINLKAQSRMLDEAQQAIGFLAFPASFDKPASSKKTQEELNWAITAPGLLSDIEDQYFQD